MISLCCHAYIGSPEGSYRYKSVLIRPLHSILKIRRRARIRSLRSRKTPSKAVAIIQVKSPEGLVMLSKEEKEGIDRKDIMVAKMSRISKKLHQSLGSKQNPDPYVLFLQEFCGLKAVVSMCCIGFSDWRGDGTRNATCPCCATGHTFFNSHGVVFKEGEDSGKSGSEGRLGSCGGAEVSRTVDVSELFGIEVGGHNGH